LIELVTVPVMKNKIKIKNKILSEILRKPDSFWAQKGILADEFTSEAITSAGGGRGCFSLADGGSKKLSPNPDPAPNWLGFEREKKGYDSCDED